MIQTIDRTATGGIDRPGPPPSPTPVAPPATLRGPAIRRPSAPGDQRGGLPSSDAGRSLPGSLGARLIDAIRPTSRVKASVKPLGVRLSLLRVADAIEALEVDTADPLLTTAHRLLAEEQLRVEMVRHRLQMVLEG